MSPNTIFLLCLFSAIIGYLYGFNLGADHGRSDEKWRRYWEEKEKRDHD